MTDEKIKRINELYAKKKAGTLTEEEAKEQAIKILNDGGAIGLFPEGTRSRDGKLGSFYSAGFRRLEETVKLPVVVCALDGGWQLSRLTDVLKNLYKGAYKVKILKVYDAPATKEDEKKIIEEAPGLIQAQLDLWRSE